jgi:hypothetical protein
MGNAAECVGTCEFRRHFVVDVALHADLLGFFLDQSNRNEALRQFANEVLAETETAEGFERAQARLRARAKSLVARPPIENAPQAAPPDERSEIWRCACCGQVEAPKDCLGVCIRRKADFVLAPTHDELAARIDGLEGESRALTALARLIAWSAPKAGQTEAARLAFRKEAMTRCGSPYGR